MTYTSKKQLARNVPKYIFLLKHYIAACAFALFYIGTVALTTHDSNHYVLLYLPEIKMGLIATVILINIVNRLFKQNLFLKSLIILDAMTFFNIVFLAQVPFFLLIAVGSYGYLSIMKQYLPEPEKYDYRNTRTTTTYSRKYIKQKHIDSKTKTHRTYHKIR